MIILEKFKGVTGEGENLTTNFNVHLSNMTNLDLSIRRERKIKRDLQKDKRKVLRNWIRGGDLGQKVSK